MLSNEFQDYHLSVLQNLRLTDTCNQVNQVKVAPDMADPITFRETIALNDTQHAKRLSKLAFNGSQLAKLKKVNSSHVTAIKIIG